MSFDECFYVYGGQQAFEELESLSNECARSARQLLHERCECCACCAAREVSRPQRHILHPGVYACAFKGKETAGCTGCADTCGVRRAAHRAAACCTRCAEQAFQRPRRLCNRVRGRLSEEEKAGLDRVLSLLGPIFDLAAESPAEGGAGTGTAAAQGGGPAGPEPAALVRGHAMIADLAAAGGAEVPAGTSRRRAMRRLCVSGVCFVCCWFPGGRVEECNEGRG